MTTLSQLECDQAAIDHCREVTRREARNFYYGLRLLPEPQRSSLFCIYAWMRQADDLADDEAGLSDPEAAAENLDRFRGNTHQAIAGNLPSNDPMWRAFHAIVNHYQLDEKPFDEMIDGQVADLQFVQPQTMGQLVDYCRQVASSVGQVCISIWGFDDSSAPELADQRGLAFQLTNILRDVREDHANGRIYLPVDMLESCELDVPSLLDWAHPDRCTLLVRSLVEIAETHYRQSAPLDAMITSSCRPTLQAMTGIYHGLLRRIARNPAAISGSERVRLGSLRKLSIALAAKVKATIQ